MAFNWLHVSDFHFRSGDSFERDLVLRSLPQAVETRRKNGQRVDAVFATGDIADAGKADEYDQATRFFDNLLEAAGLDRRRLFVVPGNHDVDRKRGKFLMRTLDGHEDANEFFDPKTPKPHLTEKLGAFRAWHDVYFKGIRAWPADSTCGPVGQVEAGGLKLGILPMNSALFCQGEDDQDKLWLGRRCLDAAMAELTALGADLAIGLIHHPLDWINGLERANIDTRLAGALDILLRGHLHETDMRLSAGINGSLLHLAAGAAYQTLKWPNRALFASTDGRQVTVLPLHYVDAPQETWTVDTRLFPHDRDFRRSFPLPKRHGQDQVPTTSRVITGTGKAELQSSARATGVVLRKRKSLKELDEIAENLKITR
jgi:predicted phosphodiesterase